MSTTDSLYEAKDQVDSSPDRILEDKADDGADFWTKVGKLR